MMLLILLFMAIAQGNASCKGGGDFSRFINQKFTCGVFKSFQANPVDCHKECMATLNCFAVNTYRDKINEMCDLINTTSRQLSDRSCLTPSSGAEYDEMVISSFSCSADGPCSSQRQALSNDWYQLGSYKYKHFKKRQVWDEASRTCAAQGGNLASINSKQELQFITEVFVKSYEVQKDAMDTLKPKHYWKLEKQDKDITLHGGAKYPFTTSRYPGSLQLVGNNGDYATTPIIDLRSTSFSITFWFRLESFIPNYTFGYLFSYWASGDTMATIQVNKISSGIQIRVYFHMGGLSTLYGNARVNLLAWHHLAVTWDMAQKTAILYQDGVRIAVKVSSSAGEFGLPSARAFDIGYKRDDGSVRLNVKMARLAIFTRALTREDINLILDSPNIKYYVRSYTIWIAKTHKYTDFDSAISAPGSPCIGVMTIDPAGKMNKISCTNNIEFICKIQV